ncbi:MAG: hypothetical protein ABJB55_06120 [Actinomycetota bacterium]
MMISLVRRLRHEEDGYALVVAMLLLSIMMVSLVVALDSGSSAFRESEYGVRWARTLTVAESGIDNAMVLLSESRTSPSPCPTTGSTVCTTDDGQYQVDWTSAANGSMTITSTGYYPTKAALEFDRQVRVLLEPIPTFNYAIFSQNNLEVKNNETVNGSIYSTGDVLVHNNTTICGSVMSANGSITLENGTVLVKSNAATGCTGQDALAWAGGSINGTLGVNIAGDAKASAPSGTACSSTSSSYSITGGTVQGKATACGKITSTTSNPLPGVNTTPPAVESIPTFAFNAGSYTSLTCYPSSGTCGPLNTSATAYSTFNTYEAANKLAMKGNFAIWQAAPSKNTVVSLDGIHLTGDLTIITNAPIDFGNTSSITSSVPAQLVVISTYIPPAGSSCTTNGGDCSIYMQNKITFDKGVASDPTDGIASLIYTSGKLEIKNSADGEGALYAGSMDIKNGYTIAYNSRIAKVLGFGAGLQPTLWQELAN